MRVPVLSVAVAATLASWCFSVPAAWAQDASSELPVVTVGMVIDGPWARNDEISELFRREIIELTRLDYDARFPEDKRLISDWTVEGVRRDFDRLLADPEVDIVYAMGVLASNEAILHRDLPKPVIAPFVIDYEFQGAPAEIGEADKLVSGVENLSYLTTPWEAGRDLEELYRIVPFAKVAVMVDERLLAASGAIIDKITSTAQSYGVAFQIIPILDRAQPALDMLDADVDVVMVSALLNMPDEETAALVAGINARRLPSMALFGRRQVEQGLLLGVAPDTNFTRVARRVAIHTQEILMSELASQLPIEVARPRELVINMETAREIGFSPTWDVYTEAELLHQQDMSHPLLTLQEAVQQAVDSNLDYLAAVRQVAVQTQVARQAQAPLLPSLDAGFTGLSIDPTRASQSLGQQPQHTLAAALTLDQLIYSDAAWAARDVQRFALEATEYDSEAARLDTVRAAAVAYLNVLIAATFEQIQLRNVDLSRTNLELATARQEVGVASRAEVFRWQSEIASDRSAVIDATVQRNLAEIDLNRLRSRPLEEPFRTVSDIEESEFRQPMEDLTEFIDDRDSFDVFRQFMVQEGLRDAPELAAIDAGIEAQQRVLTSTQRSFWLPDFGFRAQLDYLFADGGAGADVGGDLPVLFDPPKTSWAFAVNAAYPVYRGDARYAERERARQELALLRLQRRSAAQRIEQRVRAELHRMVGSYAQIDLAEEAADAALRNLELVQDAYSQGVANIIDLIDAQNAALTATLARATAVYEFMINLTDVGRSISNFDFLSTANPGARQEWMRRAREFFEAARRSGGSDAP
ncbi:MAG: TolC family protein [Acidobacteriota bacterium]